MRELDAEFLRGAGEAGVTAISRSDDHIWRPIAIKLDLDGSPIVELDPMGDLWRRVTALMLDYARFHGAGNGQYRVDHTRDAYKLGVWFGEQVATSSLRVVELDQREAERGSL